MNAIATYISRRIVQWAQAREPDFVIGGKDRPYLKRHWLLPRNPIFNAYVHQFLRSDDDRALHDHPWLFNLSWLLDGPYREWVPGGFWRRTKNDDSKWVPDPLNPRPIERKPGSWYFRWGRAPHRVELLNEFVPVDGPGFVSVTRPVWTLFITGPRVREWGFNCPKGWVHWKVFTAANDEGAIGKGCA